MVFVDKFDLNDLFVQKNALAFPSKLVPIRHANNQWHPDRLARNSVDGGKVMLSIAFSQSKYYVDNLSENIKRGHRNKGKE